MRITLETITSLRLAGPVLQADVDWARGRIAAVVDEASGVSVLEWDDAGLRKLLELGGDLRPPDGAAGTDVILHPEQDIAISVGWERPVRIWSLLSGGLIGECGDPALAPPGAGGPWASTRRGFYGALLSCCGRYLDTFNLGRRRGERFDWRTGVQVASRWGGPGPIVRHPQGDLLALGTGDGGPVHFASCQAATTRWLPIAFHPFVPCAVAFGPGALAAVGGETTVHVIVLDLPSFTPRFAIQSDTVAPATAELFGVSQAVAWSPDGRTLYIAGGDGAIVALDANDGHERARWRVHAAMVTKLIHHPREARLLSVGLDGTVVLHRTHSTELPEADATLTNAASDLQALLDRYPPIEADPDEGGDAYTEVDAPPYLPRVRS